MILSILLACSGADPKPLAAQADDDTGETTEATPPENGLNTFAHDGLDRRYRLYVPDTIAPAAALVVVMHGYTSSAQVIEGYSGMNALADEYGFVVVYPQGTEDDWGNRYFNVGYDFHESDGVDDFGYLHALIEHLQLALQLNSGNVFSMGMSNGGDMSYLLACQSDVVRAIAPIAGCMVKHIYDSCSPNRPIPVLEVHGTLDDITLVEGDIDNQEGWGAYMPLQDTIDFWTTHNQLDLSEVIDVEDTSSSDGSTVRHHRYYAQGNDTEVSLYEVIGGGHDWPGAFGNQDIDASLLAWQFFSKYLE